MVVSIRAHGFMCNFFLCVRLYFLSSECIDFSLYLRYIGAFQGVCIFLSILPCRQVKSRKNFMDRRLLTTQTHVKIPCVHDCNVTSLYHVHAQLDHFCAQSEGFGYAAYMCIKDSRPREYKSVHCIIS